MAKWLVSKAPRLILMARPVVGLEGAVLEYNGEVLAFGLALGLNDATLGL